MIGLKMSNDRQENFQNLSSVVINWKFRTLDRTQILIGLCIFNYLSLRLAKIDSRIMNLVNLVELDMSNNEIEIIPGNCMSIFLNLFAPSVSTFLYQFLRGRVVTQNRYQTQNSHEENLQKLHA